MRVLMLDQTGQLGGAELAMLELCERAAFEWQAVLFEEGPFGQRLARLGAPVEVISSGAVVGVRRGGALKSMAALFFGITSMVWRIARKARACDVIYANTQKSMVIGALAGLIARRPVVWYLHDIVTSEHFGKVQLSVVKWISKLLLSEIVCNSEASKTALLALTGSDAEQFDVVYNGIAAEPYDRVASDPQSALRVRFGLPADAFLVGCFSRLSSWKGQHILIEAIAATPDVHAVLVGAPLFNEEPYETALRELAAALGVGHRVHFLGFHEDIPAMMRSIDVVAHTSIAPEPFGRVIVEGMLAERPVVATRAGGVPEIIDHDRSGLLIAPGDVDALREAIVALRSNVPLVRRLTKAGRDKARNSFTPDEHCRQMTQVLERQWPGRNAPGYQAASARKTSG